MVRLSNFQFLDEPRVLLDLVSFVVQDVLGISNVCFQASSFLKHVVQAHGSALPTWTPCNLITLKTETRILSEYLEQTSKDKG